jgi:hypothetical protein
MEVIRGHSPTFQGRNVRRGHFMHHATVLFKEK